MSMKITMKLLLGAALMAFPCLSRAEGAATNSPAASKPASTATSLYDEVVAKGKGLEIKRSQLEDEFVRLKAQMVSQGQSLPPEHRDMVEANLLQQIIGLQLISAKATEADKTAGKTLAEKRFAEAKTRLGSDDMVNMKLKAEGLTREELLQKWTDQAAAEAVLDRELKVTVTEDQAKKFYDENPGRFEQPEMARASHILISTRDASQKELSQEQKTAKKKTAEDILKRARAGEDFAKLAKDLSDDPGSKNNGGEYTFPRGRMVPEFEAAAFALKPGQISDLVTTSFGYHIIKLSEIIPAKKVEFAKVVDDLKNGLKAQEIQKLIPDYVAKLKQEAGVEILDDKLKPVVTNGPALNPPGRAKAPALPAGHPAVETKK